MFMCMQDNKMYRKTGLKGYIWMPSLGKRHVTVHFQLLLFWVYCSICSYSFHPLNLPTGRLTSLKPNPGKNPACIIIYICMKPIKQYNYTS